jgi:DNA-binding NtrC family response regulator
MEWAYVQAPSHTTERRSAAARLLVVGGEENPAWENTAELTVARAVDPWEAMEALRRGGFDAVLARLPLAGWTPTELLEGLLRAGRGIPCLFEGEGSLEEAVRLVKLGAFHYLPVGGPASQLLEIVRRALETADAGDGIAANDWCRFLVGSSTAMKSVRDTIRLIARRRSTVLITGETGTGKEMVARAIHAAGNRANKPLVAVNCSALPENLLEAELFGHVKGAFTGAIQNRAGRFEQAHQGTIFLDEVAEMPLELQAKLLRVLQEREFQRLGSSETIKVDVRVIAACNVDPEERIRCGKFREDLYYRLNVVPIRIPALRHRLSDVPLLVHHFLRKICDAEEITAKKLAPETLHRLAQYNWPGNVRQLENAVEMAIALSGDRSILYASDFPLPWTAPGRLPAGGSTAVPAITVPDGGIDFEETVGTIERGLLEQALDRTNGNKKQAAELLRLKRTTLTAKLKSLGAAGGRRS